MKLKQSPRRGSADGNCSTAAVVRWRHFRSVICRLSEAAAAVSSKRLRASDDDDDDEVLTGILEIQSKSLMMKNLAVG